MLQSDQFCLLTSTSLRLRLTCASNFDGIPYAVGSIMRPISRFDGGISSRCALAAAIPVADAAVAPAKTTPRRRNLRLACDWGELVSTTLSVADPLRDLGPRATSVFCMTVSSRLLAALFVVVFTQSGFVATAGHRLCATRCCSCQVALASVRTAKPIAGEQKPPNKFGLCRKRARLLPLGETGRALAGATNIHGVCRNVRRRTAETAWHSQVYAADGPVPTIRVSVAKPQTGSNRWT